MNFGGDYGGWGARWTGSVPCEVGDLIVASFSKTDRDGENHPTIANSSGVTILSQEYVMGYNIVAEATSTSFSFQVSVAQGSNYDAYPRCAYWIFR